VRFEFRIPISPTDGFFSQVRFFNAALRRFGGPCAESLLTVVVGDHCDIEDVIRRNAWSRPYLVRWVKVPDDIFDRSHYFGTGMFRLLLESDADIIVLSDADTVAVRDISPIGDLLGAGDAAIAGHMAHFPPPDMGQDPPILFGESFWHDLFRDFGLPFPDRLFRYSIDPEGRLPLAPAYFNLGFVAMNQAALAVFAREIFAWEGPINRRITSWMWVQVAYTLIAYAHRMRIHVLGAEYNAANDDSHFAHNRLDTDSIRVIHYLRVGEVDRSKIFLPDRFGGFLEAKLDNSVNRLLQRVARELASAM